MKAILLSAGRGRRLARVTDGAPKCLAPVHDGRSILEFQLRAIARAGIERAVVMVGYGADRIDRCLAGLQVPGLEVRTGYNPFSANSDNLVTAWLARPEMSGDFLLLNGDTLFEDAVLQRLLEHGAGPATMAISRKSQYDADDMKVVLDARGRLRTIGKNLGDTIPDGEAIGMTVFRGSGGVAFREVLDELVRSPEAMGAWYTSALDVLADRVPVQPVSVRDLWWAEVDTESDLFAVRQALRERRPSPAGRVHPVVSIA